MRSTSRHVGIQYGGVVLAETNRAMMLFEGSFPLARYYLPPEDVRVDLRRSARRTACAYKGHATHYSAFLDGRELVDIAWSYEHPLAGATQILGLVAFYQERLTLVVDGELMARLRTPWS